MKKNKTKQGEVFLSYFCGCEVASERSALFACVSETSDKLREKSQKDKP